MNKNLLSENMLRFGTKNLNEWQQRELIVKSIMETINNNGLHGDVRRRLMEQVDPTSVKPAGQIKTYTDKPAADILGYKSVAFSTVSCEYDSGSGRVHISMMPTVSYAKKLNLNIYYIGPYELTVTYGRYAKVVPPTTKLEVGQMLTNIKSFEDPSVADQGFGVITPSAEAMSKKVYSIATYGMNSQTKKAWGNPEGKKLGIQMEQIICHCLGIS